MYAITIELLDDHKAEFCDMEIDKETFINWMHIGKDVDNGVIKVRDTLYAVLYSVEEQRIPAIKRAEETYLNETMHWALAGT